MKALISLTLIALFYSLTSCAQTKISEGLMSINDEKFVVKKSTVAYKNTRPLYIHSLRNKYSNLIPAPKDKYPFRVLKSDIHVDVELVKKIVYQILICKRASLNSKNESIFIHFVFETNGTLTDTGYTLTEGTIITPTDMEKIDAELRRLVKATFTGADYNHYTAVDYYLPKIIF